MMFLVIELYFAAQRIHISEQTKEVLDTFTIFDMELRGEMEIKVTSSNIIIKGQYKPAKCIIDAQYGDNQSEFIA